MNQQLLLTSYFIFGVMVLLITLGLGVAVAMPGIDRWSKRFFTAFFSILVLLLAVTLVDAAVYGKPGLALLEKAATFIEYVLSPVPIPMMTVYLLHCCVVDRRNAPLFRVVLFLCGLYIVMLIVNQFTEFFYWITPESEFFRSFWHPLLILPLIVNQLLTLGYAIRWRRRLSRKHFIAFLIYLLPLLVVMLIHSFIYIPVFVYIGIGICALTMFGIILSDEVDHYLRQQQEIARQRNRIMVLQMRPHFIYNTMTSIYYLCKQDPEKAQQVTLDFTTYLRKNFTAIASDETIPFAEELEHTRAYLAVEQAQHEENLFVEFDTPHTRFRIPPLTLQPIVENAVKHGMDPDSEALRIVIRTRKTKSNSEIIVEDSGPGFDPSDNDKPHIALANIRERLEMMCGGRLRIAPRKAGGTVVTVTVPKAWKARS